MTPKEKVAKRRADRERKRRVIIAMMAAQASGPNSPRVEFALAEPKEQR